MLPLNTNPTNKELLWFARLWFPLFALVIGSLLYRFAPTASWCVWIACAALSLAGMWRPAIIRPIFVALMVITFPIGFVISTVIMAVIFFAVLTPIGLVLRLTRPDPMRRKFEPDAVSYWEDIVEPENESTYFQQY